MRRARHTRSARRPNRNRVAHGSAQSSGESIGSSQPLHRRTQHEKMHDERLWDLRQKRDRVMHRIPNGRTFGRSLRRSRNTRSPVSTSISTVRGQCEIEWDPRPLGARRAEHNRIVHDILRDHGATSLIKSKSMLTEECGFRDYMASVGVKVIETDLGSASSNSTTRIRAMSWCLPCTNCAPTWLRYSPRRSAQTLATATSTTWRKRSATRLASDPQS